VAQRKRRIYRSLRFVNNFVSTGVVVSRSDAEPDAFAEEMSSNSGITLVVLPSPGN